MPTEQTPLVDNTGSEPSGSSKQAIASSKASIHTAFRDGPDTNLLKFRRAVGINANISTTSFNYDVEAARRQSCGLYAQVIRLARSYSLKYTIIDMLFYICLLSQIIIGATLASLGGTAKLHPTAIIALGVINSSVGAILALLKGQGLPDRMRKNGFEMIKVRDYIEEMDGRLVLDEGTRKVTLERLDAIVEKCWNMYNAARDTAELNRPDNYRQQAEADAAPLAEGNASAPRSADEAEGKKQTTMK